MEYDVLGVYLVDFKNNIGWENVRKTLCAGFK